MKSLPPKWIYGILAFGLLVRLALPLILGGDPYRGDGADYQRYATNLYEEGVYSGQFGPGVEPEAGRMPGVPFLIWIGLQFFSPHSYGMLLPNILLGWGILLILHFFLHDFRLRPKIHLISLAIYAAFPVIDYYASQFYPDLPAASLAFLSSWAFARYLRSGSGKWALVSALALGLGLFFRPELLMIFPLYLVAIWLTKISLRQKLIHSLVSGAAIFLVLAPWMLRNLNTLHVLMPLGNNFIIEDNYQSQGTCARGLYRWLNTWHYKESHVKVAAWYLMDGTAEPIPDLAFDNPEEKALLQRIQASSAYTCDMDAELDQLAQNRAAAHPWRQNLILPLQRFFYLLFRTERADSFSSPSLPGWLTFLAWLALGVFTGIVHLAGLGLPFIKQIPKGITLLLWLMCLERLLFFALFYHVENRYMLVYFPIFFLLAASQINRLLDNKIDYDHSGSPKNSRSVD
ncbi:MAG: glycosyltransferase family 39 protein [Bacteroidia bacterium]|nr:glycosyltransferase family 39 protein [Bacteroidia bacterium]